MSFAGSDAEDGNGADDLEQQGAETRAPQHPLVEHAPRAVATMRFIRVEALRKLAAPIPRCQDLPEEFFGVMRASDKLIAVSHGWRFQMHPDPYGQEVKPLQALLSEIVAKHGGPDCDLYAFVDFLAIPQRPYAKGQAERSEDEEDTFREALMHLDSVFMYADVLVHIDVPVATPKDEGKVYSLPDVDVASLDVRPIAGILQCTSPYSFDHVLSINGTSVYSVSQMLRLMAGQTTVEVSLERHAFGLPNMVSCSDRGWIYLERFITMVVAAMVDERDFKNTVFANKVEILQEIHAGAQCLRQAAERDALYNREEDIGPMRSLASGRSGGGGATVRSCRTGSSSVVKWSSTGSSVSALTVVFAGFEEQLKPKKFSAASVDKSLNPSLRMVNSVKPKHSEDTTHTQSTAASASESLLPSDAVLVAEIMENLVTRLASQWQAVQSKRLSRPLVVQQIENYVIEWDSFTPKFLERIQEECRWDPWLYVQMLVTPCFLALAPLMLPYTRPDAGAWANWVHVFMGLYWIGFVCFLYVPQWIQIFVDTPLPLRCTLGWPFLACLITSTPVVIFSAASGIYPVPFSPPSAAMTYFFPLCMLYFMLPRSLRFDPRLNRKIIWSMGVQLALTTTFCLAYPVLNVMLHRSHNTGHVLFMGLVFLSARVGFERFCEMVSRRLGPDVLPGAVFVAEISYQVALCDFFRNVQHWQVFLLFISVDLFENAYYLYCFHRGQPKIASTRTQLVATTRSIMSRTRSDGSTTSNDTNNSTDSDSSQCSALRGAAAEADFVDGSAASVAAVLLLREFADLLVPTMFMVILGVLYASPAKQFNGWVSSLSPQDLQRTLTFLAADILCELIMTSVSFYMLRSRGVKPLHFLRGLIVGGGRAYYITAATTGIMWYASLQLAHSGCDFSFQFLWATQDNAVWRDGAHWDLKP